MHYVGLCFSLEGRSMDFMTLFIIPFSVGVCVCLVDRLFFKSKYLHKFAWIIKSIIDIFPYRIYNKNKKRDKIDFDLIKKITHIVEIIAVRPSFNKPKDKYQRLLYNKEWDIIKYSKEFNDIMLCMNNFYHQYNFIEISHEDLSDTWDLKIYWYIR